jgi:hypothetical protein
MRYTASSHEVERHGNCGESCINIQAQLPINKKTGDHNVTSPNKDAEALAQPVGEAGTAWFRGQQEVSC